MGVRRLPRLRIDRKNGSFVLATWALTAATVGWGAWKARHGGGAGTGAYFVCLTSIAISFLLATFESPVEHAVIGLIFAGFPVMAVASYAVPPDAGYFARVRDNGGTQCIRCHRRAGSRCR